MARRFQIKIYNWSTGALEQTLSDAVIVSGVNRRTLAGDETLSLKIDLDHPDSQYIPLGAFVNHKLTLVDTVDVWERHYQVTHMKRVRNKSTYHLEFECVAVWYELGGEIHELSGSLIDQTPTTHMTQILTGSEWVVGTVTPTSFITVQYNYNSRLFDLQQISEATGYELDFTAVPGGAKTVNLVAVGTTPSASIAFAKNIDNLVEDVSTPEANVVYGLGGESDQGVPANIGFATHRITNIAGNILTLDSRKIISTSGDWDGFAIEKPDGSITEITDSTKPGSGNDQLTVASAAGLAINDAVRIVTNTSPQARVPYVHNTLSQGFFGKVAIVIRDEGAAEILNLLGPADFSTLSGTYTTGLCDGWSVLGITSALQEIADPTYVIHGTKSQKVVIAAYTATPNFDTVSVLAQLGDLNGAYTYKISHITEGGEGPLSAASSTVNPANQKVQVTLTSEIVLETVTHWRIYRTKAGGSTYYRLGDVPIATLSFVDNIADDNLTIQPPVTTDGESGMGVKRTFTTIAGEQYAAIVYGYVDSGSVMAQLRSGDYIFPPPSQANRGTTSVSSKTPFAIELEGFEAQDVTSTIEVVAHDGPATFYVDSAIVVASPYVPDKDKFVADNDMTELWYKCFDELMRKKDTDTKISLKAFDLHELDDSEDEINIGDEITITDSVLGTNTTVRVTGKTFDMVSPYLADFEFEFIPGNIKPHRRLTDEYYERRKREKEISTTLARKLTRLTGQMKSDIFSNKRAKVQISNITE